jgi:hypothetical protein
MMNKYEFIHDKYAGFTFEHNIGNGFSVLFPNLSSGSFILLKPFGVA